MLYDQDTFKSRFLGIRRVWEGDFNSAVSASFGSGYTFALLDTVCIVEPDDDITHPFRLQMMQMMMLVKGAWSTLSLFGALQFFDQFDVFTFI